MARIDEAIKQLRQRIDGESQLGLQKLSGVGRARIREFRDGRANLTMNSLLALEQALDSMRGVEND